MIKFIAILPWVKTMGVGHGVLGLVFGPFPPGGFHAPGAVKTEGR